MYILNTIALSIAIYTGTDPEDLKGGWLDTVAKGTSAEVGDGRLWGLYRGVCMRACSPRKFWKFKCSENDSGAI